MSARAPRRLLAGALLAAGLSAAAGAQEVEVDLGPAEVPATMTADEARPALDRALGWLVEAQRADGSLCSPLLETVWEAGFSVESYYAWQVAAQALGVLALLEAEETPERRAALEAGVRFLCTTRMPKRGNHWDNDAVWAYLYGVETLTRVAADPRFQGEEWAALVDARGREMYAELEDNQVPDGGWAYYDDPIYSRRPKWSTSFCTALALPAVQRALALGWGEDAEVLARAIRAVWRCALPNGAWTYSVNAIPWGGAGESINHVKGSLGRIQVCHWGLASVGERKITPERIREGLGSFFEHHRFLDVARMRPIPHEAYYANAGYFYLFAHYYAAEAIELLPAEEREAWHARLRPHLVKVQYRGGDVTDFLGTGYLRVSGTAYAALALQMGMDEVATGTPGGAEPTEAPAPAEPR